MSTPKTPPKHYIALSIYGYEAGHGKTLESAFGSLKDVTEDVQSPEDCEFYEATHIVVETKIYIVEGK